MDSIGLLTFSLVIYFFYHLINRADITSGLRNWLTTSYLHDKVLYSIRCCFCMSFHLTLFSWVFYAIPFYWVFACPVIGLMIDKLLNHE